MRVALTITLLSTIALTGCSREAPPASPAPSTPAAAPAAAPPPAPRRASPPDPALLHGAPPPAGELLDKLYDVQQDLESLAAGRITAEDVASDINSLADPELATDLVMALVRPIAETLKGKTLDPGTRDKLAAALYAAARSPALTTSAREALAKDIATTLRDLGAAAPVATRASNATLKLQPATTR